MKLNMISDPKIALKVKDSLKNSISTRLLSIQCVCFAIFYSTLNYPQTNFLSDLGMIIGATSGVYTLIKYKNFFITKEAAPFWITMLLIFWMIIHLIFLSNDFELQLNELSKIWKRVIIVVLFGLSFGIGLVNSTSKIKYFWIFYVGISMPPVIFILKHFLGVAAAYIQWNIPEYLRNYSSRDSLFYISKVEHASFTIPVIAASLGLIKYNLKKGWIYIKESLIYFSMVIIGFGSFYIADIRNGIAHTIFLFCFFYTLLVINIIRNHKNISVYSSKLFYKKIILFIFTNAIIFAILNNHINNNQSWKYFLADAQIAVQIEKYDNWKYWKIFHKNGGYPINKYGREVSSSNYERIAWGVVGTNLLIENPLGFGLIENSFGFISGRKWPDSSLSQSHSGWLDLALGIGIPGLLLVFCAIYLSLHNSVKKIFQIKSKVHEGKWVVLTAWALFGLTLFWATSEISFKIHIVSLFFWISFLMGLSSQKSAQCSI